MFPMFKPKIAPLSGDELYEFTKKMTGLDGNIASVLSTPEATVLSVYDVYSWAKWMYDWYPEKQIYEMVIRSRRYPNERDLLNQSSNISSVKDFIKFILNAEEQTLSEDKIDVLMDKYNINRAVVFKK